ncbi:hypothetical protein IJG20_03460 [Candidatus Saccharibacteria bacterium]|nr:hypothetical protein [Candidatus Saccharibacteria bacterium]
MQLIIILLNAVALLTILTGASIMFGAAKQSRTNAVWFFFATLGAAVWSAAIASFLKLPESSANLAPFIVSGIIAGITLTDISLLGYLGWASEKNGKLATIFFIVFGAVIIALLVHNPALFYSGVTFGNDFNTIHTTGGWYFVVLIIYFTAISLVYSSFLTNTIKRIKNRGAKNGLRIFQIGLSVGGILALIFDLIFLSKLPNLAWIGPMAVSISIITFYYSVVKYHIMPLSGRWMQILSYIIIIAAGIAFYVVVFYIVFTALFRIPNPTTEILVLNFIMTAIVICLMPALSEILSILRAFLPTKQLDVGYITRRLNVLTKENLNLRELAGFLSQQLKFEYVGLLVDKKLYGSKPLKISEEDLKSIEKLKPPKSSIWQELGERRESDEQIARIAALEDEKGKMIGQVLIGRPTNGRLTDRRNLIEIEMVLKLVAVILDGETA